MAMVSVSRFLYSLTISPKLRHSLFSAAFFSSFSTSSGGVVSESVAYLRSMSRPPSMVPTRKLRRNSCSFVGTLDSCVYCYGNGSRDLAFAFLKVKSDHREPNSSRFCVCLWFKDQLAEISLKHLKQKDFIYVSGTLGSYKKPSASGEPLIFYKVNVQDLNYVARLHQHQTTAMPAKPVAGELSPSPSGPTHEQKHLDRMHLWQLFFASPNEWWDNRQLKRNPRAPDFKHKDTKECLWVCQHDPPWVTRQLQLHDANVAAGRFQRNNDVLFRSLGKFEVF